MSEISQRAQTFVYGQFLLIVLTLIGCGSLPQFNLVGSSVLSLGLLLGAWALATNRPDNFNLNPTPRVGGSLCFDGPYRLILHPMYVALIIALGGIVLMNACLVSLIAWGGLIVLLERKAALEEKLLRERSGDYENHCEKTKRFIPFIY